MVRRGIVICAGVLALCAAPAAAQWPPPVPGRAVTASPPTGEFPLPTDGLMAPVPAVPPRTAYQTPAFPPTAPPVRPAPPDFTLPDGTTIPIPDAVTRQFRFIPRYGRGINETNERLQDGTRRWVITGGVIVNVTDPKGSGEIEFAADEAVIWVRGLAIDKIANGFQTNPDQKTEIEVYLGGNVIIRTRTQTTIAGTSGLNQTLRAAQVYYDVERNRAVALNADLELSNSTIPDGVHLTGSEIRRLDVENWEALDASAFSSKLPSDPALRLDTRRMTLSERKTIRKNVFGIPYRDLLTGQPVEGYERIITSQNVVTRLNDVPVFYLPYLKTDATEPLGPLLGLGFGQDRIFGTQAYTTWDVYKLLALRPPPGHRWRLDVDYLSDRGPGFGTDYNYTLPPREGSFGNAGAGFVRLYGISDGGVDVLGGDRGPPIGHPAFRGRAIWRHQQEIMEGLYFQGQAAYLSDQNFYEQFYNNEFNYGPNQETFAYLTWQRQNLWAAGLVQGKIYQNWMSTTETFPRVDAAWVGQSVFDLFTYTSRVNLEYAQARPSTVNPFPVLTTDRAIDTGRFNSTQELSLPFALGAVKLAPYGMLDLTQYTEALDGSAQGRVYGGGGLRGSLPFTRLYEDATSELFNVRGLNHKVMLGANYFYSRSNTPFTNLPYLDRQNDDATDYAYRYIIPQEPSLIAGPTGVALGQPSPIYNPQLYAIRRLVFTQIDTRDSIQVLQGDLRQRFQTKRGYPGLEHTVDVFTLDLSASYFPQSDQNFSKSWSFLEYGALWNVGDRTSLVSNGWFDPFDGGARYYTIGAFLNRPDRTNFYVGYRQTDPLNSKAVTAAVGYQLSRRYYMNLGASYDFGINAALSNSFSLTRTGSDLTVSLGFTYNSLVNNFGVQFLVVPNLVAFAAPGRFGSFSR